MRIAWVSYFIGWKKRKKEVSSARAKVREIIKEKNKNKDIFDQSNRIVNSIE